MYKTTVELSFLRSLVLHLGYYTFKENAIHKVYTYAPIDKTV